MKLDCKDTGGVVGKPVFATSASSPANKSVSYSGPMGDMSSGPNLSTKFKNPSVKQEVPEKGKGQYE